MQNFRGQGNVLYTIDDLKIIKPFYWDKNDRYIMNFKCFNDEIITRVNQTV